MTDKLRVLDARFFGTERSEVGPCSRRMATYGAIRGLVFGHWVETSPVIEDLLSGCAHYGSVRHWRGMRAQDMPMAHSHGNCGAVGV